MESQTWPSSVCTFLIGTRTCCCIMPSSSTPEAPLASDQSATSNLTSVTSPRPLSRSLPAKPRALPPSASLGEPTVNSQATRVPFFTWMLLSMVRPAAINRFVPSSRFPSSPSARRVATSSMIKAPGMLFANSGFSMKSRPRGIVRRWARSGISGLKMPKTFMANHAVLIRKTRWEDSAEVDCTRGKAKPLNHCISSRSTDQGAKPSLSVILMILTRRPCCRLRRSSVARRTSQTHRM
mmetsp:Transcript_39041/g.103167  ORF Transcript_39041/g.103167 Transcript_39041/m.103167 type:complete len:238 (+) Transcript_39041:306-1019(+)